MLPNTKEIYVSLCFESEGRYLNLSLFWCLENRNNVGNLNWLATGEAKSDLQSDSKRWGYVSTVCRNLVRPADKEIVQTGDSLKRSFQEEQ